VERIWDDHPSSPRSGISQIPHRPTHNTQRSGKTDKRRAVRFVSRLGIASSSKGLRNTGEFNVKSALGKDNVDLREHRVEGHSANHRRWPRLSPKQSP